jgi:hypothetical protein
MDTVDASKVELPPSGGLKNTGRNSGEFMENERLEVAVRPLRAIFTNG